jgi:hypothetical protein
MILLCDLPSHKPKAQNSTQVLRDFRLQNRNILAGDKVVYRLATSNPR